MSHLGSLKRLSYIGASAAVLCSGMPALAQVDLPPGFEVVEIAVDDRFTSRPSINICGQIVYSKQENTPPYDAEIYMYDNGRVVQVTNDPSAFDDFPSINDVGDITWSRHPMSEELTQVVFLHDGVETVVVEGRAVLQPALNNLGHVVWSAWQPGVCDRNINIFFWDGDQVIQITPDDAYYDQSPAINDFDEIVWTHMDACRNPWRGHIQAYWDGQIVDLPVVDGQDQTPDINNDRHVTWRAGQDVVIWRQGETRIVTEHGAAPQVNENDEVYAPVWNDARRFWEPYVFRVRRNNVESYRFHQGEYSYTDGSINDRGEATCRWLNDPEHGDFGGGVLFLRAIRTGNTDADEDVDLRDHRRLTKCMTGPLRRDGLCDCRFLDIDHDGDVDLADYSAFQGSFNPG